MNLKVNFLCLSLFFILSCTNPFGKNTSVQSSFTPGIDGDNLNNGEPLLILGLENDSNIVNEKTWTWTCNRPCTSRFTIDQTPLTVPTGVYASTQTAAINVGDGTFYIHVQARDNAGNVSEVFHALVILDNTPPVLEGQLVFTTFDRSASQTNTMTWVEAATAPAPIDRYEMSISTDNGDEVCNSSDLSEDTLSFFPVPSTADFSTTGYQVIQGNSDNNGATLNFTLLESTFYCISLRAIDSLDQVSNTIFSQPMRLSISPSSFGDLFAWVDSAAPDSLFQNTDCSTSPAMNSDAVGCWRDQSLFGRHFIQSNASRRPLRSASGIVFDGMDDFLTNASISFNADTDTTYFIVTEVENQSNNSGSCCRPLISFVTNSSNFYPWVGSTRGNISPPNSIFHGWQAGNPVNPIATSPGDSFLISTLHDGTLKLWTTFTNGSQTASNLNIPANYSATTPLNIGGDSNNAARLYHGSIQEIIFYDRVLNITEVQDIEGYLACKWDLRDQLNTDHPYYNMDGSSESNCP